MLGRFRALDMTIFDCLLFSVLVQAFSMCATRYILTSFVCVSLLHVSQETYRARKGISQIPVGNLYHARKGISRRKAQLQSRFSYCLLESFFRPIILGILPEFLRGDRVILDGEQSVEVLSITSDKIDTAVHCHRRLGDRGS